MFIDKNGEITTPNSGEWSNEDIVFMYLSMRGAYESRRLELQKKMKQAKALQGLLTTLAEDEDQNRTAAEIKKKIEEMSSKVEEETPEDKFIVSIFSKLKPKFLMIKEADNEVVKKVVDDCFRGDNKIIQKLLEETD
jgi:hypothetical protein